MPSFQAAGTAKPYISDIMGRKAAHRIPVRQDGKIDVTFLPFVLVPPETNGEPPRAFFVRRPDENIIPIRLNRDDFVQPNPLTLLKLL